MDDGSRAATGFGQFILDRGDERLIGPEGSVRIGNKAYRVLCALVERPSVLLTKDELFDRVWDGVIVSESALTSVIKELRRALGDEARQPRFIESVYGRGYRFVAATAPVARPPAASPLAPAPVADTVAASPRWRRRTLLGIGIAAGAASIAVHRYGAREERGPVGQAPAFVVVLPFEDVGEDRDAAFLSVALPREIRDQLSRVAGLRVIAETSSRQVADRGLDHPRGIGARLGARFVVSGAIGETGGQLRSTVRIFDIPAGREIVTHSRTAPATALFALQQQLSGLILREILGRVPTAVAASAVPRVARDPRAYRLVLEGRDFLEKGRVARMTGDEAGGVIAGDAAARLAERALAIDPQDPGALLLLAHLVRNGWTSADAAEPLSSGARAARSITYVSRALAADPNEPAALTALGDYYRRFEWRWAEAETLFRKALMLSPSFVEAHWSYAYMLGTVGRGLEGLGHARTVFALDPESLWHRIALPRLLGVVGDRGNMFRRYDVELAANPDNLFLVNELYLVHLCDGDAHALDRLATRVRELRGGGAASPGLAALLARIGEAAGALRGDRSAYVARIDADVRAHDRAPSAPSHLHHGRLGVDQLYIHAIEYAWAGETGSALGLLERALTGRSIYWPATAPYGATPLPAAVRADPRHAAIWNGDAPVRALVELRRQALLGQTMAGFFPDGRFVRPSQEAIDRSIAGA